MASNFLWQEVRRHGNSTTAEDVSRFHRLFPIPQLVDARKGIRSTKTRSNTHEDNCLMVTGPLVSRVNS